MKTNKKVRTNIELGMFIHEVDQVKSMNFNGNSIMDCSLKKLTKICAEALQRYDNYQQLFADNGKSELVQFFVDVYDELEEVFFHLKEGGLISLNTRNEIRMRIKGAEKYAASELS